MKQRIILFAITLFSISGLHLSAQITVSGLLDSSVSMRAGAGGGPAYSFGLEEYANLRLGIRTGEKAAFYAAFNLIAVSGNYLENAASMGSLGQNSPLASTPFVYGENYAAGMELERLYFRINGDYVDAEAGLLRMNFGYGQVWGSSDFLNPRNPLFPNARPRGVLGADVSFYPSDSFKLMGFAAAPEDPLESGGGGFIPGFSMDKHWDRASLQALYAYQTPFPESEAGIHRFGLSFKADMELGLVVDALYALKTDDGEGIDGLSIGAGFDYSFLDGNLYFLAEYLFNGNVSATALGSGGSWTNRNYLYGTALYRFNDYCNLSFSTVFCFDDLSFSPFATLNYELFQGLSLNLNLRFPLDQKTLNGGKAGELGPIPPKPDGSEGEGGTRFAVDASVRLRF